VDDAFGGVVVLKGAEVRALLRRQVGHGLPQPGIGTFPTPAELIAVAERLGR
jgi:hypothetical protein